MMRMKPPAVALFTFVSFGCSSTDNASSQGVADGTNASSGGASSGGGAAVAEAGSSAGAGAGGGTAAGAAGSGAEPGSAGTSGSTASSAGSGGAGASTGGASTAGASGGSPNPCAARPGLLFCDDFEAATAGVAPGAPWSSNVIGSTSADIVAVDDTTAYAHSGRKSVHVHGASYQNFLSYHDAAVLPRTNSKFFLRAFVRFDAAMTVGRNTFVLADTFAAPNTGFTWRVGEMSSMLMTAVNKGPRGTFTSPTRRM